MAPKALLDQVAEVSQGPSVVFHQLARKAVLDLAEQPRAIWPGQLDQGLWRERPARRVRTT